MALTEQTSPPRASHSSNIRFLAHCDQGGRPDGVQVMVHKGHAFVGHMFSDGFSVIDVRDPRKPRTVAFVAAPKNTRSHHLQISDDILLAVNGPNIWAMQQYASQADYYGRSLADSVTTEQPFGAGLRVFDVSQPEKPREIGFLHMPGFGAHRIWWVGGRYAYVSVHFDGYIDHTLAIVDVSNPRKPTLAGHWWLPGMHRAGGEEKPVSFGKRTALHHMITAGRLGYAAWRDGGFTVHDLTEPTKPKLISHRNYSPPFGGGAHTPLPLPGRKLLVLADEATSTNCANGLAYVWVIDVREAANPVSIATLPTPKEEDFCKKGAKFGPHNLHENRPGSWQSEEVVFATYHNAGLRIYDIRDAFAPRQIGYFVPPPPERIVDQRPNPARVIQSCDVFVDVNGVMYLTDTNAGLYILQYDGR
ncbi:MAG TPA: hypothetical protein VFA57_18900 [Pseudolabrys sp.]|nr:hypothetical protein [Pseudolabrys sp.]